MSITKNNKIEASDITTSLEAVNTKVTAVDSKLGNYLPLNGGTMTGRIDFQGINGIYSSTEDTVLRVVGGTGAFVGSRIDLFGADRTENKGLVQITVRNRDAESMLKLLPDGTAIWGGKNIVRTVNGTSADATGNVSLNISAPVTSVNGMTGAVTISSVSTATTATKATTTPNIYTYFAGDGSTGTATLPSGGTWAYYLFGYHVSSENTTYSAPKGGTASGGTSFQKCKAMIAIRKA